MIMNGQMGSIEYLDIKDLEQVLSLDNSVIITDDNVYKLYKNLFGRRVIVLKAGEGTKNLNTINDICLSLAQLNCDRKVTLIAVGGGVIGDTVGFAASVYMRGVQWINLPTTLLAQVDSAIGGKTGVDVGGYKNIAGAFYLPKKIYIATQFISTLPPREWLCGMGEVIKTAALDKEIFEFLQANFNAIKNRDSEVVNKVIQICSQFKHRVTTQDFTEKGLRKILNFGHTAGHALETADNLSRSHGEYVLLGILAECDFYKNKLQPKFYNALKAMIRDLDIQPLEFDVAAVVAAAKTDKKNAGGLISIMSAVDAGKVEECFLTSDEFMDKMEKWKKSN